MADQLLTQKEIANRLGCHRHTIRNRVERGTFPEPDINDTRKKQWLESTVNGWFVQIRTSEQVSEAK